MGSNYSTQTGDTKMTKLKTESRELVANDGSAVNVNVPIGPICEPAAHLRALVNSSYDPTNWKNEMMPFATSSFELALAYADAVDFYVGGHQMTNSSAACSPRYDAITVWVVTSKGYYHFIGA